MKTDRPKKNGRSTARRANAAARFWAWLGVSSNQKTLQFVGAGIAAAVALLVTAGIIGQGKTGPPEAPAKAVQTSAANPAVSTPLANQAAIPTPTAQAAATAGASLPPSAQTAAAGGQGVAVNVQGRDNRVSVGKGNE